MEVSDTFLLGFIQSKNYIVERIEKLFVYKYEVRSNEFYAKIFNYLKQYREKYKDIIYNVINLHVFTVAYYNGSQDKIKQNKIFYINDEIRRSDINIIENYNDTAYYIDVLIYIENPPLEVQIINNNIEDAKKLTDNFLIEAQKKYQEAQKKYEENFNKSMEKFNEIFENKLKQVNAEIDKKINKINISDFDVSGIKNQIIEKVKCTELKIDVGLPDCPICYSEKCNTVCVPCGHICSCLDCSKNLKKCPLCREDAMIIKCYV